MCVCVCVCGVCVCECVCVCVCVCVVYVCVCPLGTGEVGERGGGICYGRWEVWEDGRGRLRGDYLMILFVVL